MKNAKRIFGIAVFTAVIVFTLTAASCFGGGGNQFNGTSWEGFDNSGEYVTISFSASEYSIEYPANPDSKGSGAYTAKGNTATIKHNRGTTTAAISGNTLDFSGGGDSITLTKMTGSAAIAKNTGGSGKWTVAEDSTFHSDGDLLRSVAWGNGKFVVGSHVGEMAYSADGITWTRVIDSTFGINDIFAITWGNGMFVAGGNNGNMAYSADGINWTRVEFSEMGGWISGIVWGNDKFVAVGRNGAMVYSANGVRWTPVRDSTFGRSNINGIAYGGGKFVAGGAEGKIAYSTDGINWTASTDKTFGEYEDWDAIRTIVWGANKFVAIGDKGDMAYSADGIKWTAVETAIAGFTCLAWGENKFFVQVPGARSDVVDVMTSPDGINWTRSINTNPNEIPWVAAAYGSNKFVTVGHKGIIAYWQP